MTRRGRVVLALGLFVYVAAWAFGSKPLYPVATGLLLVSAASWAWLRLAKRPFRVRRGSGDHEHVEGEDVPVMVQLESTGRMLPPAATLVERIGRLGEQRHPLSRHRRRLSVRYVLRELPRGRYVFEHGRVELGDPFGLQRSTVEIPSPGALLVYPRLVELRRLFSDAGAVSHAGQRMLLRRPAGFDLHSVREYEHGDSLRRVHWRSTAKRRRLMVKELTDMPRDESSVLLDCDRNGNVGAPGHSSFDAQVRAAASLLNRMVERGQRCSLVLHGQTLRRIRIQAGGGEWGTALAALAAVRANADRPLSQMVRDALGATGAAEAVDAARLYVVTAALTPALASRLLAMRSARRDVAVVWVDAPSFAGVQRVPGEADAASPQLARAGVSVARLGADDDISAVLSAAISRSASNA